VVDLLHRAVVALAQLADDIQFVHVDLEAGAILEINALGSEDRLLGEFERT
jgi:hypothetical protein